MQACLKQVIKSAFKRLGYDLVKRRPPPLSGEEPSTTDAFYEQCRLIGGKITPVIFDVGAHHGQTSLKYLEMFPSAQIFAFEPFLSSFQELRANVSMKAEITPLNLALGDFNGEAAMSVNRSSATNSLLQTDYRASESWNNTRVTETVDTVNVTVATISHFLGLHQKIDCIDILKIDAQGSEMAILKGGKDAALNKRIAIIYMEIIIMPTYVGQCELDETLQFVRSLGFVLHNFFNPCFTNEGRINQVDALFVRSDLARTN
jgi:FkbM family methyltransferase